MADTLTLGPADLALRHDETWPFYAEDEIDAVASVLRSGHVNQWTGAEVFAFESACVKTFGGGHGVAVANGSVALELALRAFAIGPGDEVIVSPRSFVASAFCARLVGATPVFVDVDANSGAITAGTIAAALTPRTRAVIPVHLAGWPADMPMIMTLAEEHGLRIIEDCAQSPGASIDGRPAGSFGDAAAFSFCQDKIITTGGEGGFTQFRDPEAAAWARSFKDHGKNWQKHAAPPDRPGRFRWVHDSIGTNWRLTGPQASIGLAQLEKLCSWLTTRERNARIWAEALSAVPGLRLPLPDSRIRHAYYKLYAYVDAPEGRANFLRNQILERAAEVGLRVFSGSCSEIYLERGFADLPKPDLPTTRLLGEASLMVEVHPTLDPELIEKRAKTLARIAAEVLS